MASSTAVLSLRGKGLKLDSRADIQPYLEPYDPTVIEEIHLGGNTLGVDASIALADFLTKATALKVADFADIFTGRLISEIPFALTAICDVLKDTKTLVELDLSDNAFGGRCVDPIVPFLIHNRNFQVLKLNNNGLGPSGGNILANALTESARLSKVEGKKSNLRTFICGRNRLEDGSADAWAEVFSAHGTLVEVRMPQNGIRMTGMSSLARGLAKCTDLEHLDFHDNTFTENGGPNTGLQAWTEALPSWPSLRILNLSDCVLSNIGEVPLLLETLTAGSNPNLHSLQLQNNNLENRTFALLAEAITSGLGRLMELDLQDNDQEEDDKHLEALASLLKSRGGKLYAFEEEEREDQEAESEEAESVSGEPRQPADKEALELADLFSKVSIH